MDRFCKTVVVSFFIAGIMYAPFSLEFPAVFTETTRLFTVATLSSLATAFLLLNYPRLKEFLFGNKLLTFLLLVFFGASTAHFFVFKNYSFNDFFFSLFWISVPLFAFLFSDIVSKYLPVYLYIFWVLDMAVSLFRVGEKIGVTGNRNWHASFLIVVFIFSIYLTYGVIKRLICRKTFFANLLIVFIGLITTVFTAYTIYLFYMCNSRGATLAATAIVLLFIALKIISRLQLSKTKVLYVSLCCFILVCIILSIMLYIIPYHISKIEPYNGATRSQPASLSSELITLNRDVRIPLWKGAIHLIKDNPLSGVGAARFESAFAPYRPIEYFAKPYHAVRSNHPHNTLLYIASCFGIPVLIIWCLLWIYPLIYCFLDYSNLTGFMRITLLAYIALFLHGQLDLVLFQLPTFLIAAILLGLLWSKTWGSNIQELKNISKDWIAKLVIYPTASLVLLLTLYNVYLNYRASYYFGLGNYYRARKMDSRAVYQFQRGISFVKEPKYIYQAGIYYMTSFNNPELTLFFFDYYNKIATFDFAHKNGFTALALLRMGKEKLTIPYLTKEVINFPISVGAWYRLSMIQNSLNLEKEAEFSLKGAWKALSYKGLPQNAKTLKLLVENPMYDSHPEKIPKNILEELKN